MAALEVVSAATKKKKRRAKGMCIHTYEYTWEHSHKPWNNAAALTLKRGGGHIILSTYFKGVPQAY